MPTYKVPGGTLLYECECGVRLVMRPQDFPFVCQCMRPADVSMAVPVSGHRSRRSRSAKPALRRQAATVTDEQFDRRLAICENCPGGHFTEHGFCRLCPACNHGRRESFRRLVRFANAKCPAGYWPAVNVKPLMYITSAQRTQDTLSLVPRLPDNLAAVCGVARSGIAPAVELAMALHLPLFIISEQSGVLDPGNGYRLGDGSLKTGPILVMDDSRGTGRSARRAMLIAGNKWPDRKIIHAALYVNRESMARKPATDLWVREMDEFHLFEWNLHNSPFFAGKIAYDFDGVLCHDWDGKTSHEHWIQHAQPLHLPRRDEIPLIVTGRLEKYREVSERWLARWGVRVRRLVMWKGTEEERWRGTPSAIAEWKAANYSASGLTLMIESDAKQAGEIAAISGKPVLCPGAGRVF